MTELLPLQFKSQTPRNARPMIIDSFAGGGGASTGILAALGRSPDVAINHDAAAISMHEANHPETKHYNCNIWNVDPSEVARGQRVGLAWFSPDCFPAGTMILTAQGYRPIEEVKIGDFVLTHKGRWRKVTKTMSTTRDLLAIKSQGSPEILVSSEHPFLARSVTNVWDNASGRYRRTLGNAEWVKAGELKAGKAPMNAAGGDLSFVATPNVFEQISIPQVPTVANRSMTIDARLMWLAGRYLGDGWSRLENGRAELVITCANTEADDLGATLSAWQREGSRARTDELSWHRRQTGTATQFATNSESLVRWLRAEFGHGAALKTIPGWALGMDKGLRTALLEGYMSADGHDRLVKGNGTRESYSISRRLSLGLKSLVESLGFAARLHGPYERAPNQIEGRDVTSKPAYSVRWRPMHIKAQHVRDDTHTWRPLTSIGKTGTKAEVFNISVDEDESYVAESVVVHNCTHHSKAKGGKPVSAGRRDLAWVVVLWARRTRPEVIMLENVEEFRDWGPLDENQRPCKARKGQTFKKWVRELERLGYKVESKELRGCDYGTPTIRKRLFLVARCDGRPIVWPKPTHAPANDPRVLAGKLKPYISAADIIDWTIPCPSIFSSKAEIKQELGLSVRRPLADPTLRRIARGVNRYVIEAENPFVVSTDRGAALPALVQTGYGEREGQAPRSLDPFQPMGTMVAGGSKHGVVSAFLAQHNAGPGMMNNAGRSAQEPVSTITTTGSQQGIVSASLLSLHGKDRRDADIRAPHPTICAGGTHSAVIASFLREFGSGDAGRIPDDARVTIDGQDYVIDDIGMRMLSVPEMYRAQGFPSDYIIDRGHDGRKLTKTEQTRMCGNSVCPPLAQAIVSANCPHLVEHRESIAA